MYVVELSILCTYKAQFINGYFILFLLQRAKSIETELSFVQDQEKIKKVLTLILIVVI